MRLNVKTYLAVILSAVTVAALPESPATARSLRHHYWHRQYCGYARYHHWHRHYHGYSHHYHGYRHYYGYYGPRGYYGPYTPALPVPRYGRNPDFQTGPRG